MNLKPSDRHGQLLGPGYASRIDFALDGVAGWTVRDREDGSYEIIAALPDPDKAADEIYATLWVAGERMFRGPVSQLIGKGDYCPSGVNRNFNSLGTRYYERGPIVAKPVQGDRTTASCGIKRWGQRAGTNLPQGDRRSAHP